MEKMESDDTITKQGALSVPGIAPPGFRELVRLSLPMIASQASETVMTFVDRLFLSRFGKVSIAASMSGGLSFFVFVSFFAGIVGYTNAIVAQYYGAGRKDRCVQTAVQGFYLSLFFLPLTLLLIPLVHRLFILVGHSPEQVALEFAYFKILMFGGVAVLLRNTLVGFFLGVGKSKVVMAANLVGMVVNVPLNYILIFGKLGFPALGIRGAALGTVAGSITIVLILLVAFLRHPYVKSCRKAGGIWRFRADGVSRLVRFGLPAGTELFLNVFAFNLFVQLMHSMGPDVAAAVTITFNYDMVAFVPMLGLGISVTSLVGRQMGGGNPQGARKATIMALKLGYSYACIMMLLFIFGADPLVRLFASGMDGGDAELIALAKTMLRLAALYTLADITQLLFSGALRGAGDTRFVMFLSVAIHWAMAVGAVLLIKVLKAGPVQVWIFFIGFVIIMGLSIFARFASGRWESIKVIEEDLISEIHQPRAKVQSEWM